MTILSIVACVTCIFLLGYRFYGRILSREFGLDNNNQTPAHLNQDGIDFVPTPAKVLLPQHFSAIAAAGPIVGPILAGLWFGWLPVLLWVIVGNIFIGAAHDFATLTASVRHRARSVAEVVRENMSNRASILFLIFIWIALIYVIVAFTDLTASTFTASQFGGGVATSSVLYLLLSVGMGILINRFRLPLWAVTAVSIPLLVFLIWGGQKIPLILPELSFLTPAQGWGIVILVYCFIASILPMSVLLQPRGYLGGYFLYGTLFVGMVGLIFGGYQAHYPAFIGFTNPKGDPLFPILFVTVACGACSGFHGLVCGGTSSKQLDKEHDAHSVGYGGMLLEGMVAMIALATIMMFPKGDPALALGPTEIYANGLAHFAGVLGVPPEVAISFGLLAFATFVYDTLDVATRLGRYIFQELTGWNNAIYATLITLALPLFFLLTTKEAAYLKFWAIFGASNQLLAALSLLGISVWLIKAGKNPWYTLIPMGFVLVINLYTLARVITPVFTKGEIDTIKVVAAILLTIALLLLFEAYQTIIQYKRKQVE
ncbi:MAG: carbon starvation protein A [Nitrospirota bacterium]